mgnify:CR=1 FL=1
MRVPRVFALIVTSFAVASACVAAPTPITIFDALPPQAERGARSNDVGVLHLQTRLGSFKMVDGRGRVEIAFTGTVLISGLQADEDAGRRAKYQGISPLDGSLQVTGNVRREWSGQSRQVFFGTGRIVLNGRFRGIQWFGRDMQARWIGDGIIRMYGEFDRDLHTGWFWYDNIERATPWGAVGMQAVLPEPTFGGTAEPEIVRPRRAPNPGR